ncbi:MAG: hypothetical protein M3Z23_16465, partial [Acidobacteriota bacterium]|nr:hypothetical protein [Acidobacteriota bacterium]
MLLLLLVSGVLVSSGFAFAQSSRALPPIPTYEVTRAPSAVTIDGKLDEAAWSAAGVIEFQFPWSQQTGAKQKTTARLL